MIILNTYSLAQNVVYILRVEEGAEKGEVIKLPVLTENTGTDTYLVHL